MIKLALLIFAVFALLAIVQTFRTVSSTQKAVRRRSRSHKRRLINSEAVAIQLAEGLVRETAEKYPEMANQALKSGIIPKKLESELETVMDHYRERVIPRFKPLFHMAVNKVILNKSQ